MFLILGYEIFRNFGIWDIGIYFGIRVKLILGYGIFWTVHFRIWDTVQLSLKIQILINTEIAQIH